MEGLSAYLEARWQIDIPISLRPAGVSEEGCCGRQPVAVDQYSSSLCLACRGQSINSYLIFQINTCIRAEGNRLGPAS